MIGIVVGDCLDALPAIPTGTVDAIVTDPPYGLEFMGKEWDRLSGQPGYNERGRITDRAGEDHNPARGAGRRPVNSFQAGRPMQDWHEAWACEALRVLKPGGHLLAFGGTRTSHRLVCAIEDAGFEIRDSLCWLYGSGFPKSLNVSKAIDKAAGAERAVVGQRTDGRYAYGFTEQAKKAMGGVVAAESETGFSGAMGQITAPATPEAERWEGWGTALKPAHEPIVLARKPLTGTVAGNVLTHGTGALNVDGCRIVGPASAGGSISGETALGQGSGWNAHNNRPTEIDRAMVDGRWPANVLLDPEAAAMLDEQTGVSVSRKGTQRTGVNGDGWGMTVTGAEYADSGGASRFFYVAKASSKERNAGLEGFEAMPSAKVGAGLQSSVGPSAEAHGLTAGTTSSEDRRARNHHPTVKPIALMRWLVRLVTPPGGIVLDPFTGSGTTGIACVLEGLNFIGVEREADYAAIARARIAEVVA